MTDANMMMVTIQNWHDHSPWKMLQGKKHLADFDISVGPITITRMALIVEDAGNKVLWPEAIHMPDGRQFPFYEITDDAFFSTVMDLVERFPRENKHGVLTFGPVACESLSPHIQDFDFEDEEQTGLLARFTLYCGPVMLDDLCLAREDGEFVVRPQTMERDRYGDTEIYSITDPELRNTVNMLARAEFQKPGSCPNSRRWEL